MTTEQMNVIMNLIMLLLFIMFLVLVFLVVRGFWRMYKEEKEINKKL